MEGTARTPQCLTLTGATALTSTVSRPEHLLKKKKKRKRPKRPFAAFLHFILSLAALRVCRRDGVAHRARPPLVRGVDTRLKRSLQLHFSKEQRKDGKSAAHEPTLSRASVRICSLQKLWSGCEDAADDAESQVSRQPH